MKTTYTNAPVDYDGFGTRTVKVVGKTANGPVRKVETLDEHVEWQRSRYESGPFFAASEATFPRIASVIEPLS